MSQEDIDATKAPLMDHLIELRSRLIKALVAVLLMFILCFAFSKHIYNILVWPFVWVAGPENSPRSPYPLASPGRTPLTATIRLVSDRAGRSGIVAASGGGTIPYRRGAGRTEAYTRRASRSCCRPGRRSASTRRARRPAPRSNPALCPLPLM